MLITLLALTICFLSAHRRLFKYTRPEISVSRPPHLPNHRPLGLDRIEQIIRAFIELRFLGLVLRTLRETGTTISQTLLGFTAIGTIDPENVAAILDCKTGGLEVFTLFDSTALLMTLDWSLGSRRPIMMPLLGNGIFTQEGLEWKRSRALLRPCFRSMHYENFELFARPVNDLISQLNTDTTGDVDPQPLFFQLALRSALPSYLAWTSGATTLIM